MTSSLPVAGQKWSSSLGELSCRPWREVGEVCKDAAVFLDDGAAELLHWAGGMKLLSGSVGLYDLHAQLSPVARDFIAAVSWRKRISFSNCFFFLSTGPILSCCHSNQYISPWCGE